MRRFATAWLFAATVVACAPPAASSAPLPVADPHLTAAQRARLTTLSERADAAPRDFAARRASGMAHMWLTLSGLGHMRERAELDLEAAFALDPTDATLTRTLGRFYNLRAVAGDRERAARQVEVYAAHLGDTPVESMSVSQFVAWSFSRLGAVLEQRNRGHLLGALASIKRLEAALARRVAGDPGNVELHALAGNFAFFFAGSLPFDRRSRVALAVSHFEVVRERWAQMRAGARDSDHCPNTRENFMFELAEGYLVLGRTDEAATIHAELMVVQPPYTRAKEQIAFVAAERLHNAQAYVGEMKLMPPWPSDTGNCVVCHAWTADVSMDSLYSLTPILVADIERREPANTIPWPL